MNGRTRALRVGLVVVATGAAALLACASSDSGGGQSSSGGGADGSAAGADGATDGAISDVTLTVDASDGGFCNRLDQLGKPQSIVSSSQKEPTPLGGVISEGTYVGAGAIAYTTLFPDGSKIGDLAAVTLTIKGNQVDELTSYSAVSQERSTGTFSTTGASITIVQTCQFPIGDGGLPPPTGYTVTGTTLTLFTTVSGIPAELRLTKQ